MPTLSWLSFRHKTKLWSIILSQLRQAASPSTGKPEPIYELSWVDFVQLVLELTVKAYRAMYQDRIARRDWEENVFSLRLAVDYLRRIAFDSESSVRVHWRGKNPTERMKKGEQATIEAKEFDLMLYGTWEKDYYDKHFIWEAKRVGDKRVGKEYSKLNPEYVNEAIYRFIRREYADTLSDAGVLGYVLAGDVADIVSDINVCMGRIRRNPPLPETNHLRLGEAIDNFEDIYQSQHTRTDNTTINLYHLFLSFEFA
jgi:hypothetical protein